MFEKIYVLLVCFFGLTLFYVLSQPAWRGEEMVAELRSDCDKRGGVILEHKKRLSTHYECASRLD